MEELLPWKELERPIARDYSKSLRGRKPYPLSVMLRIHCMQLFYDLWIPIPVMNSRIEYKINTATTPE